MIETQKTVSDWALATFGERNAQYRALMVLEESLELCSASGVDQEAIESYTRHVIEKIGKQEGRAMRQEEAADVLSTLYAYANTIGVDVHAELDKKMAFNRTRPQAYYDAKTRQKGLKTTIASLILIALPCVSAGAQIKAQIKEKPGFGEKKAKTLDWSFVKDWRFSLGIGLSGAGLLADQQSSRAAEHRGGIETNPNVRDASGHLVWSFSRAVHNSGVKGGR